MDEFTVTSGHLTRATTYVLPMLGKKYTDFPENAMCFIGDTNKPDLTNHIFLLIKKKLDPWFIQNLEALTLKEEYNSSYDCNNGYIMLVFNIPEEFKDAYYKFKNSQFSLLEDNYKRKILNFHNLNLYSKVAKTLYRSEDLYKEWEKTIGIPIPRNQEAGTKINPALEIYDEERMNKSIIKRLKKNEHQQ
jgi:hypothetical protein